MSTIQEAECCYTLADLISGAFGQHYTELQTAQSAYDCALEEGTKANVAMCDVDEACALAHAEKFLFLCAVSEDGTLTAI